MTDIKELALRVATQTDDAVGDYPGTKWLHEYSKRFLAAYLAEQEPVAYLHPNSDTVYWPKLNRPPDAFPLFTAPPLPEPAPQQEATLRTGESRAHQVDGNPPAVCAAPTKEQALEALDSMDDFARMADVDAIGPRKVLEDYINGAATSSEEVREIVRYIRCLAMPDPFDERPVMHQKELTQAANLIERLAARVPDGCVVVPREPTKEMVAASWHAAGSVRFGDGQEKYIAIAYQAMIAAGEAK